VVGAHTGKDYIIFTGVDIETAKVHEATIEIASGKLQSFVIDCGEW
jgi:hypothetical protein